MPAEGFKLAPKYQEVLEKCLKVLVGWTRIIAWPVLIDYLGTWIIEQLVMDNNP